MTNASSGFDARPKSGHLHGTPEPQDHLPFRDQVAIDDFELLFHRDGGREPSSALYTRQAVPWRGCRDRRQDSVQDVPL